MLHNVVGVPGEPHRWRDEICAWAAGGLVQWRYALTNVPGHLRLKVENVWRDCDYCNAGMPNWHHPDIEYRVAPAVGAGHGLSIPMTEGSTPSRGTTEPYLLWEDDGSY